MKVEAVEDTGALVWQAQGHAIIQITPRVGFFWNLGEKMVSVTKRRKMEEGRLVGRVESSFRHLRDLVK